MKEILPIVMNDQFERLAVVDDYMSFIWTSRYYDVGDFELVVGVKAEYMQLFKADYYITRDDDENIGIIEDIVIEHRDGGNDVLIVTGRFLASILGRRIIGTQTTVSGKLSACIYDLISDNIINPSVAVRKINNFICSDAVIDINMEAQYTGKNLLMTVSDLCETYGVGFKVTLNDQNQFVFQLYQGADHTYDQQQNPFIIFSDKYDNLLSSEYEENYQNMVTAVLVAGEGEGLDRTVTWVTDGSTGLDRREVYKDQRQIRSNDGEISEDEYIKLLQEAGKESLTAYTTAFAGVVYFENLVYKQDVNLGDLCVIENSRWGLYLNTRLVEVIESVSETGEYSILPTFGV